MSQGASNCQPLVASIILPGDLSGQTYFCGAYLSTANANTQSGTVRGQVQNTLFTKWANTAPFVYFRSILILYNSQNLTINILK